MSSYWADDEIEEVRIAAAHLLTEPEPKIELRYLVRILESDVTEAGLWVEDSLLGETGIPWVDFRHRDIVGPKEHFERLAKIILERLRAGRDRIRRIGRAQFEAAYQHFAALPATARLTRTSEIIACVVNKTPVADLKSDVALLKEELARITIPEETIALRAHCLEETGRGTGSCDRNWTKAVDELRDVYADEFLRKLIAK
ncbi:MAG: hypothetical protein K2R98_05885 [Gemmataceae bacterium]|nr:hypothetical protein [Gemmataceae bacterium]